MNLLALGEESAVRTSILDDDTAAKGATQHLAREKDANIRVGIWMWWTDGLGSDDGRVGARAVFKHGHQWRFHQSGLGTGCMKVFDAKLLWISLALYQTIKNRNTLRKLGVRMVAGFHNLQTAIRLTSHLELGSRQPVAWQVRRRAPTLRTNAIITETH